MSILTKREERRNLNSQVAPAKPVTKVINEFKYIQNGITPVTIKGIDKNGLIPPILRHYPEVNELEYRGT